MAPAPGVRPVEGNWVSPAARGVSMRSPSRFRFLNEEHDLSADGEWNRESLPKLWLYNLHYFDDLNAQDAFSRTDWHRALISRWILENAPGTGTGWEPYPLSLRIVNWIKWALAGNELDEIARHSLGVQARFLTRRLEHHILGNHLFVNAKALVFAGCFFEGDEGGEWLALGMSILEREIAEQFLPDGGQFERSPMYHALAYEDMLDLFNLAQAYPAVFARFAGATASWRPLIARMERWLAAMCHPDGEIAFFNDAAIGIAPAPAELFAYAARLDVSAAPRFDTITHLDPSGYIRVALGPAVLLIDAAPVGPDYLPGHAHADTLSYELSLHGQRVVVNSGTSRYGLGPERERQRSTAAHSTLEIDGHSSSEVWAGFRVARRAYPLDVLVTRDGGTVVVEAAHDGYRRLPGGPVHRRRWRLDERGLEVIDFIEGRFSSGNSRTYLHPSIEIEKVGAGGFLSWAGRRIHWKASATTTCVESANWHPQFGASVPNKLVTIKVFPQAGGATCRFLLDWA
jgi:uncharacterized heparinase superfamily protein